MGDIFSLPPPEPFWFANSESLEELFRVELSLINRLLAQHTDLRTLLDTPVAAVSERKTCFAVLAYRKVLEMISEMFAARYEQPSLSDEDSNALSAMSGLVSSDAPFWVLDMDRVVDQLPNHLFGALPQALRIARFKENDVEQIAALGTLSTVKQLQALIESVFDQQLQRLEKRWSAAIPAATIDRRARGPNKRKGWEQREQLYRAIREVLTHNLELQGIKFCAELDKRHAPPLYDWKKCGEWREGLTWKEAWANPTLCRRIRRVRQEAMKKD